MKEILAKIMKAGLYGKHTHVDPLKAVSGLDSAAAGRAPAKGTHSVRDLLHHIVVWQNAAIDAIQGQKVNWKQVNAENWPPAKYSLNDENWNGLVDQYKSGLIQLKKLIDSSDLSKTMPGWKVPVAEALLVILQHNSYHVGQIVVVREATGTWPPSV